MFLLILEKEDGERKRTKHWSAVSYKHPDWGSNPPPGYVPWPGIKLAWFRCMGRRWHSKQLSHTNQAILWFYRIKWKKKSKIQLVKLTELFHLPWPKAFPLMLLLLLVNINCLLLKLFQKTYPMRLDQGMCKPALLRRLSNLLGRTYRDSGN